MSKIIAYKLVQKKSLYSLDDEVSGLIRYGWQPFGGVSHSMSGMYESYTQTMVKYGK